MSQGHRSRVNGACNASVFALVIVMAALLYVFGAAISGDTVGLTQSIRGAEVFDTRNVP
ncbi:hypothetical protein ACCT14_22025 [Rhizobium brockwellii]|uniref:hypothetical protein n=1 Tax=Rhizobium TaxID=379 RepID=UPI0013EE76BC|nr:hypothetical protein [Rhizobium leguminosarum]